MKPLALAILAVATAVLAFGLQHASVPEDAQHERAAYKPVSGDCIPVEQSLLERGSVGLPEPLLVPQMGGLLSYNIDEEPRQRPRFIELAEPPGLDRIGRSEVPDREGG